METYLERLNAELAAGVALLPASFRTRHSDSIVQRQNPDGGFSGREGGSDLYYTGFALRSLTALDALTPAVCERAAEFLGASLTRQTGIADFFSLLYACLLIQVSGGQDVLAGRAMDWPERVAAMLESFRSRDGGYGRSSGSLHGSTYHTFLVALCYELLGRALPRPADVVQFVHSRRREDGGYVEIGPMRRSGTNPTAAAVGLLQMFEPSALQPQQEAREGVVRLLAGMPSAEGGLRANGRIPLADLLSTFTGVWSLKQLGALDCIDTTAALRYAQSLEGTAGGFRGGLWDEQTDLEYGFYGLGVLGLLS
jgi:geranylgeranyl transferase type-2 subunit beta